MESGGLGLGAGSQGMEGAGANVTGLASDRNMASATPPGWEAGLPSAITLLWVMCGLATALVLLRLYSRLVIVRIVGLDDILIVPAALFGIAMAVCSHLGWTKQTTDALASVALSYLSFVPFMLSQTIARLSFAISLLDIMGINRTRRVILYLLMALQLVECTVALAVCASVCRHVPNQWVAMLDRESGCYEEMNRWMTNGGQWFVTISDAIFDFSLALLPALALSALRVKMRVKCGLTLLMGLGVIAGISSIMRFWSLRRATSGAVPDPWAPANWTTAQTFCLLIAVCMPGAWPLLRRALHLSRARLTTLGGGSRSLSSAGPGHGTPARKPRIVVRWWPRHCGGLAPSSNGSVGAARRPVPGASVRSAWNAPRPRISPPMSMQSPRTGMAPRDVTAGDPKLKPLPNTPTSPSEERILPPPQAAPGPIAEPGSGRQPAARPDMRERSDSEETALPRPDPGWTV